MQNGKNYHKHSDSKPQTQLAIEKFADMMIARMEEMKESHWKKGWIDGTGGYGLPQNITSETTYHLAAVVSDDVDIPVEKVWEGTDKQKAELMPDAITIKLKADGNVIDTVDLSEDNQWKHTFTGLPKYKVIGEVVIKLLEELQVGRHAVADVEGEFTQTTGAHK